MNSTRVDILLSTFNGAKYLPQQLDSILNQHFTGWRLLIRDDGSSDATWDVLQSYQDRFPEKINVLPSPGKNLGACQSFGELLGLAEAPYILFSDQDDVWLTGKIDALLRHMQTLERQVGKDKPVLVHSDLQVGNARLEILHSSFWKYQHLDPRRGESVQKLLIQNVVTGSALMMNQSLRELAVPIPLDALMHDWWVALIAAAFGRIEPVAAPLVIYRQHGRNEIGAKQWRWGYVMERLVQKTDIQRGLVNSQRQAAVFLSRFQDSLPPHLYQAVAVYADLRQAGFLRKRIQLLRYGFTKTGLFRNLGLFLWI